MARHSDSSSGAPGSADADAGPVRLEARVFGMVQGVGFRYRTMGKAEELGLTGEVKNLDDGSVAVVAEGPRPQVGRLLEWLNSGHTPGQVERVEDWRSPAHGTFQGFSAR